MAARQLMRTIGSMLGNAFGKTGLFIGVMVGGISGILVVMILARRFKLIEASNHVSTLIGATLGYLIAAVTAVNNLHTPVIPILCVSLVGIGAVVGSFINRQPT